METSNYQDIKKFKETHKNCHIKAELTADDNDTVILTCQSQACERYNDIIQAYIPYRMFCFDLKGCAGRSCCPRNYACSE